jgi:tRNA(adenine34) deaminase
VARLVFGAFDPKAGAVVSLFQVLQDKRLNHSVTIESGIFQDACGKLLSRFFHKKRVIAPTGSIIKT